jgi:carbon storage regulator CsrA
MLVLSRRVGEVIYLVHRETGEEIAIAVVGQNGGQTRIGIVNPTTWEVQRGEQRYPDTAKRAQVLRLKDK